MLTGCSLLPHSVGDRSDSCTFPRHPYLAHDPYRVILEPRLTIPAATYVRMKLKAAEEVRHKKQFVGSLRKQ